MIHTIAPSGPGAAPTVVHEGTGTSSPSVHSGGDCPFPGVCFRDAVLGGCSLSSGMTSTNLLEGPPCLEAGTRGKDEARCRPYRVRVVEEGLPTRTTGSVRLPSLTRLPQAGIGVFTHSFCPIGRDLVRGALGRWSRGRRHLATPGHAQSRKGWPVPQSGSSGCPRFPSD
jgi:hypothetical protein